MSNSKVEQRKAAEIQKKEANKRRNQANKLKKKGGEEVVIGENVLFNIRKHLMTHPVLVVTRRAKHPQVMFLDEVTAAEIGNDDALVADYWKKFQLQYGERAIVFFKTGSGRVFCSILNPGPWRVKFMAQGLVIFDMNEDEPFKEPIEYGKWPKILEYKNWAEYEASLRRNNYSTITLDS